MLVTPLLLEVVEEAVVVLEVVLLVTAAALEELVMVEEEEELLVVEVAPALPAVEAGAPGSLSMVPSALLTFDPRLF